MRISVDLAVRIRMSARLSWGGSCLQVRDFSSTSCEQGAAGERWLAAIPLVNTPITKNSHLCGQHFQGGQRRGIDDDPCIFEGKKAVLARQSFSSTRRIERFDLCPPPSTSSGSSMLDEKEAEVTQHARYHHGLRLLPTWRKH